MPIVGLTDPLSVVARLPRIGKLHKGEPKQANGQVGPDTDHFRFTSSWEDVRESFRQFYGTTETIRTHGKPNEDVKTLKVYQFEAFLPYDTVEENFRTCKEAWAGNNILKHRCDGEYTSHLLRPDGTIDRTPQPCPGDCTMQGYLYLVMPLLSRFGIVELKTKSVNDIGGIYETLTGYQNILARSRQEYSTSIMGIPVIVGRELTKIGAPTENGRINRPYHQVVVTIKPEWLMAATRALTDVSRATAPQLTVNQPKLLTQGEDYNDS